ncbi:glycosyltransferase family 4 protein [Labrys sp. La1]|uniref:glycosyltransferase family 4 protein n=1 Tax=Labrys sp. La1 TaxID=3404917 RepID=UPI003EC01FEA
MQFLFDVSRHLRRLIRTTPTGIDRVDAAYIRLLPDLAGDVSFVAKMPGFNGLRRVDRLLPSTEYLAWQGLDVDEDRIYTDLADYLAASAWLSERGCRRLAETGRTEPSAARVALAGVRQVFGTRDLPPDLRGSVYLNTSHSGLENTLKIQEMKRRGARIVAMLHDLIPIDFPEFCREGEADKHHRRMLSLLQHADLIIANSAYSRDRFIAWLATITPRGERRSPAPPIVVVPLAVENEFLTRQALRPPPSQIPYFVCLGTIEARKNHTLLLLLWRRLAEKLGTACPRLVLVGRRGWKVDQVLDLLTHAAPLARHVVEVSDLSDRAVASLIAGAHGMVQPSLVEGFGLPILEANALGVPVIASDIPAHREVAELAGHHGISLVDPIDLPQWMGAVTTLASDRFELSTRVAVPTWQDHVQQALEVMRDHFQHSASKNNFVRGRPA